MSTALRDKLPYRLRPIIPLYLCVLAAVKCPLRNIEQKMKSNVQVIHYIGQSKSYTAVKFTALNAPLPTHSASVSTDLSQIERICSRRLALYSTQATFSILR